MNGYQKTEQETQEENSRVVSRTGWWDGESEV